MRRVLLGATAADREGSEVSEVPGLRLIVIAVCLSMGCYCAAEGRRSEEKSAVPQTDTQLRRAANGIQTLQGWYNQSTGQYETTGWWNSANAITVLADYARVSKLHRYDTVFANTFLNAQKTNESFLNQFYDDEGWWALAWIDAFDLTHNQQYLAMAKLIFADMAGGWDDTCGGGIWWSKERKYKNAIANELFLSVAAHLANRETSDRTRYLNWANREWNWFLGSGMINAKGLINDGLTISSVQGSVGICTNNGQTTWSYNQGVVLGGLVELARLNHDSSLPGFAQKIATAAINQLADNSGVLHDPCEPNCGADGVQFKGIFVRNLAALAKAHPQAKYAKFLDANANAVWDRSQGPNYQFGQTWSGPFDAGNAAIQSSALDAIVSAADMNLQ